MKRDNIQKLENFIELTEQFLEQSRQANGYFDIIKQYIENRQKWQNEMNISAAFYHFSHNGLVVAVLMELAKIYDRNRDSVNINKLMAEARETVLLFDKTVFDEKTEMKEKYDYFYKVVTNEEELIHSVLPAEMDFFHNENDGNNLFDEIPKTVHMTIEKYLDLYEWKYQKLETKINNLLKQRNKVYAHNDKKAIKSIDDILSKYPLNHSDIEALVSFPLNYCQFILAITTGINKAKAPNNIDDWKNTLTLVRLGEEYSEIKVENEMKKFRDSLRK